MYAIGMPLLSRAERKVGRALGTAAMNADAKQTQVLHLSVRHLFLAGLLLHALSGLLWAHPAVALIMVPIIAKDGIEGLQGKACGDCSGPRSEAAASQCAAFVSGCPIRKRRRSWAFNATIIVDALMAIAPTLIGRSIRHWTKSPAATGMAIRL